MPSERPKFSYTLEEKIFLGLTMFIAVYELVFWLLMDHPMTLHKSSGTPFWVLMISGALNSIPHLFWGTCGLFYIKKSYKSAAFLLYKQMKQKSQLKNKTDKEKEKLLEKHKIELNNLPFVHIGGVRYSFYILYISLFTLMQTYFWWLPYFFDIITSLRKEKMKIKLDGVKSILPSNNNYLIPSAEHTILYPLSLITWILTIKFFFKYRAVIITQVRSTWTNYYGLIAFSMLICYLPTSMGFMYTGKDGNEKDTGAFIISFCIILVNALFYMVVFWHPTYQKAIKRVKKTESNKTK